MNIISKVNPPIFFTSIQQAGIVQWLGQCVVQDPEPEEKPTTEPVITEMDDDSMVYDDTAQGKKRPHSSRDSDSEWKVVSRRQRLRPVPNIENTRHRDKITENNISDT